MNATNWKTFLRLVASLLISVSGMVTTTYAAEIKTYQNGYLIRDSGVCLFLPDYVNVNLFSPNWETIQDINTRLIDVLGPKDIPDCQVQYVVPQYKTSPDRPLDDIEQIKLGNKVEIGRVPYGTSCEGPILYSTSRTVYMKVTGYNGAAYCVRK